MKDVHGSLTGRARWRADPAICANNSQCLFGATDSDYVWSGYDRGHLAPNMNQRAEVGLKEQTFYLSNAAPQVGAGFNRTVWADLERDLTVLVCHAEKMWTITGPLYADSRDPQRFGGTETIGAGRVWVPSHFFKLVVWLKDNELNVFVIAMPNQRYESDDTYRSYVVSLDWLESAAQLDLLPELGDSEELYFENDFLSLPEVSWSDWMISVVMSDVVTND